MNKYNIILLIIIVGVFCLSVMYGNGYSEIFPIGNLVDKPTYQHIKAETSSLILIDDGNIFTEEKNKYEFLLTVKGVKGLVETVVDSMWHDTVVYDYSGNEIEQRHGWEYGTRYYLKLKINDETYRIELIKEKTDE